MQFAVPVLVIAARRVIVHRRAIRFREPPHRLAGHEALVTDPGGVGLRLADPRRTPVRAAEMADSSGLLLGDQRIDDGLHGLPGIVAVQPVEVDMADAEASRVA